jgi:predicted small metal-binding protein
MFQPLPRVVGEVTQNKVLQCDCGFEVRAGTEAELVAQVQHHASEAHGMRFSPEDVLQLAFRAELGEATWAQLLTDEAPRDAS